MPNETKLLVVDKESEEYYRKLDILVKGSMKNVVKLSSETGSGYNNNRSRTGSQTGSRTSRKSNRTDDVIKESVVPMNSSSNKHISSDESDSLPISTGKVQRIIKRFSKELCFQRDFGTTSYFVVLSLPQQLAGNGN